MIGYHIGNKFSFDIGLLSIEEQDDCLENLQRGLPDEHSISGVNGLPPFYRYTENLRPAPGDLAVRRQQEEIETSRAEDQAAWRRIEKKQLLINVEEAKVKVRAHYAKKSQAEREWEQHMNDTYPTELSWTKSIAWEAEQRAAKILLGK